MNIKLYNTTSPRNKLNKTLNLVADIDGESNEAIGEHNTIFIVSKGHLQGVQGSNYLLSGITGRYYYIENYEIENQCVKISCKEDVLMTFKDQIRNNTCTISRNANLSNAYLTDNGYQLLAYENIVTKTFPKGLTDEAVILLTVG